MKWVAFYLLGNLLHFYPVFKNQCSIKIFFIQRVPVSKILCRKIPLNQWFSTGALLSPEGYLIMSTYIFLVVTTW